MPMRRAEPPHSPLEPLRIAMWSGPRNLSTALLRSFENRADTAVVDEPFYAHYLRVTGLDHPGRDEIVAMGETDWRKVTRHLVGPIPGGHTLFYQKHMTHHLLPVIERDFLDRVTSVFLLRDPREVLVSYVRTRPNVTLEDLGVREQAGLFDEVAARTGTTPLALDANDLLRDPEAHLRALCEALGIPFSERMLRWPPGPRPTDGVWAKHWYASVEASTGFEPPRERRPSVPAEHRALVEEAMAHHERLHALRLRV